MNKDALKNLILFSQERKIDLVERELKIDFVGKINTIIDGKKITTVPLWKWLLK